MKSNNGLNPIEMRIKHIADLIISGTAYMDILALSDEYKVSTRTIATYIAKAKELIVSANETDIKHESSKLKARYELLFNMALEMEDIKAATTILNQQSKMFGLAEPKTDNSADGTLIIQHQFVSGNGSVLPANSFIDNGDGSDSEMDFSI